MIVACTPSSSLIHIALWVFIALHVDPLRRGLGAGLRAQLGADGFLLVVLEIVYSATDPPIKALRRVIPPLRIGTIAIDLSFIIVMIVAYMLLVHRGRVPCTLSCRVGEPASSAAPVTPVPPQALQFRRKTSSGHGRTTAGLQTTSD